MTIKEEIHHERFLNAMEDIAKTLSNIKDELRELKSIIRRGQ